MRKVELRMKEQEKYEVIKELVDHNGNKNRASKKLGISRKQIDRLVIKYKECRKSTFESSPSEEKINYTLAILTPRKINNGNSIKYQNKYYQPYLNNQLKCFMSKTDCLVIKAFNGDLLVTIDEQVLELKELSRNKRFSKDFDDIMKVKEKKKYIPTMSHPWKLSSFLKQIEKSHNQHQYA